MRLKCYDDEKIIYPILILSKSIFKLRQNGILGFSILHLVPEIFRFFKYANEKHVTSFTHRDSFRFLGLMSMARIDPKPLDPQKLQACREVRLKQKQMKLIIYDIIWYFVFVIVLLSVAHGNKDPMGYHTTSTMSNFFEENSYTDWISLSEVIAR